MCRVERAFYSGNLDNYDIILPSVATVTEWASYYNAAPRLAAAAGLMAAIASERYIQILTQSDTEVTRRPKRDARASPYSR